MALPSNLIERLSRWVTDPKVNCLLDFILVILHQSWFSVVTLREFLFVILGVEFQEFYVGGFVNVTQVRAAAEVQSVYVALLVHLCDWGRSQPSRLHLLVDVW